MPFHLRLHWVLLCVVVLDAALSVLIRCASRCYWQPSYFLQVLELCFSKLLLEPNLELLALHLLLLLLPRFPVLAELAHELLATASELVELH